MKKPLPLAALAVAALTLFAACAAFPGGAQGASVPSSAALGEVAPPAPLPGSDPAAAPAGKGWREAYAEAAAASLNADPALKPQELTLYHNYDEAPLLALHFDYRDTNADWRGHTMAWKYEGGAALLVYEGNGQITGLSAGNGNPVLFSQRQEGETYINTYVEHTLGQETPLLEEEYVPGDRTTIYRLLSDGSTWTSDTFGGKDIAEFIVRQSENLPLVANSSKYEGLDLSEKIRTFLGVSAWRPDVPEAAPAWVGNYIALLRAQLFFPTQTPDEAVNLMEEGLSAGNEDGRFPGVMLWEPPAPGAAPIIGGGFIHYQVSDSYVYPVKNRMLVFGDGIDGGYSFYKDAQGKPLICGSSYADWEWLVFWEYGFETLFRAGYNLNYGDGRNQIAYLDDEEADLGPITEDTQTEAASWVRAKTDEKLAALAYGERLDWPTREIRLPESASWTEIEPLLAEAFCEYARELGQM